MASPRRSARRSRTPPPAWHSSAREMPSASHSSRTEYHGCDDRYAGIRVGRRTRTYRFARGPEPVGDRERWRRVDDREGPTRESLHAQRSQYHHHWLRRRQSVRRIGGRHRRLYRRFPDGGRRQRQCRDQPEHGHSVHDQRPQLLHLPGDRGPAHELPGHVGLDHVDLRSGRHRADGLRQDRQRHRVQRRPVRAQRLVDLRSEPPVDRHVHRRGQHVPHNRPVVQRLELAELRTDRVLQRDARPVRIVHVHVRGLQRERRQRQPLRGHAGT